MELSNRMKLVCEREDRHAENGAACVEPGPCAVLFEARSLDQLTRSVVGWLGENPKHLPVSFNYSTETRSLPALGPAGPRSTTVYTGVLVTDHADFGARDGAERPDLRWELPRA